MTRQKQKYKTAVCQELLADSKGHKYNDFNPLRPIINQSFVNVWRKILKKATWFLPLFLLITLAIT